jgi:hypothetical protein
MDEHKRVRLADFGLTVFSDISIANMLGAYIGWPPELFEPEDEEAEPSTSAPTSGPLQTEKANVYAFAWMCMHLPVYIPK